MNKFRSHKTRPFLVSKSTFPGSGRYAGHWLGDDSSTVPQLKMSVPALLNYHMFGIPFVGSNICGYKGDAIDVLCSNWHKLGVFMPLSRNHNDRSSTAQEPYSMSQKLKSEAKYAIELKYALRLYHYF